jgi:hypothetical protein
MKSSPSLGPICFPVSDEQSVRRSSLTVVPVGPKTHHHLSLYILSIWKNPSDSVVEKVGSCSFGICPFPSAVRPANMTLDLLRSLLLRFQWILFCPLFFIFAENYETVGWKISDGTRNSCLPLDPTGTDGVTQDAMWVEDKVGLSLERGFVGTTQSRHACY